ncbi:Stp1/IreP family PP2C-type Ser/Thr phosphatase [Ancrocorticia populi]|uniref:Serine/threonine protein phosphatase PstP n=1 Tax=Ancrocorticia populi TaxID=2175228 RepID=A0A2V1KB11_9ACTO|nr:Stp1/IreP family PP2C-type Ser/Thr phosphatase [Ancrocorticia populi]PWF26921.1 Stp1/IreP family PP2C-type Ser/Thr phosphatase [Ancrocorticia populi]
MSAQLHFAAFSDIGLIRSSNQDSGYASPNLLVLADGMGGAAAGDIASSVTVGHLASIDDDVYAADDLLPVLRRAIEDSHDDLMDRSEEDPELAGLGTTCIAILRSGNKLAMVHIGDSRAYLLRDERLTQVTHDHTLVQYLVDHGQITSEQAENHPKRNVIMRALGDTPNEVELDESVREAVPGDRWLLCSDGLFGVVSKETIARTLTEYHDLNECGEHLIELALAAGAPDNVTAVLADVVSDMDSGEIPLSQQPIIVGAAALNRSRPTRGGGSAAAAAAALAAPTASNTDGPDEDDEPEKPPRRIVAKLSALLGILILVCGGVFLGYRWSQTQYYVYTAGGQVAIYQGIPQTIGPLHLSHVYETTDIELSELQPVAQDRLNTAITRSSLEGAQAVVANLELLPERPEPTPEPSASSDKGGE